MKVEAQDYLGFLERAHAIAFFDIEATGLRGDYNSVLVVSVKPYGQRPRSFLVHRPGADRRVVRDAGNYLGQFEAWVSYYGRGFDIPMLNTRRLNWGLPPIPKRHHLDLYWILKANLLMARRSQGHLLSWLRTPEKKMGVSPEEWNNVLRNPRQAMPIMVRRCESDAVGLEALYRRTRHLITEVKR